MLPGDFCISTHLCFWIAGPVLMERDPAWHMIVFAALLGTPTSRWVLHVFSNIGIWLYESETPILSFSNKQRNVKKWNDSKVICGWMLTPIHQSENNKLDFVLDCGKDAYLGVQIVFSFLDTFCYRLLIPNHCFSFKPDKDINFKLLYRCSSTWVHQ